MRLRIFGPAAIVWLLALSCAASAQTNPAATIAVDTRADRHPISPLIYGAAFASQKQIKELNFTLNRIGGNAETRYNWKVNSYNSGQDWFFASNPSGDLTPAGTIDSIVAADQADNAQTMVTLSMIGWVAKIVSPNVTLGSYPVSVFGPQQKTDPDHPDLGNGIRPDGTAIYGADPNTANVPSDVTFQKGLVDHLIQKWGPSAKGGVRFYIMDNEPGIWSYNHRDVHPYGYTSRELADDIINYGSMVKAEDPDAIVVGPEEWGWPNYINSGADGTTYLDRKSRGGMDNLPWILKYIHDHDVETGKRTLDYFTVHLYPQGGDSTDDESEKIELLRNRDTRQLWDPNYTDESWIKSNIMLIPRMKSWVASSYPGTKIGITEYNWGAEKTMNGATAQADALGIFGREGLDLAARWGIPDESTPTFQSMLMYRNYDGKDSAFGDESIADQPDCNPDLLSSFAATRNTDGALTVIVINKVLSGSTPITIALSHFAQAGSADIWQLSSGNPIAHLDPIAYTNGQIQTTVPAQSVTMFVIPRHGR